MSVSLSLYLAAYYNIHYHSYPQGSQLGQLPPDHAADRERGGRPADQALEDERQQGEAPLSVPRVPRVPCFVSECPYL